MNRNQPDPSFCKTEFHCDGENLVTGSVTSNKLNLPKSEDKYPLGRAIQVAFWLSYFTLHWLTILGVVPTCATNSGIVIYFLVLAVLTTMLTAGFEATNDK